MRRLLLAVVVASLSSGAALLACVPDADTSGLPPFDAGTITVFDGTTPLTDASPSLDSGPRDAGPGADVATNDSGGDDGGTQCTPLDLTNAPFLTITNVFDAAAPSMNGGALVPGDYVLTSAISYDSDASTTINSTPFRQAYHLTATTLIIDTEQTPLDAGADASTDAGLKETVFGQSYTTTGNQLILTQICPTAADGGAFGVEYTVIDGGFQLAHPFPPSTLIETYTAP